MAAPVTAASIAERVRAAINSGDPGRMGELMSDDVHWGPPGVAKTPCRNRAQVLTWYEKQGRAKGRRATVTELSVHENALLVGLRMNSGEARWQVLRVGPEGVNDIRGYEDRAEAAAGLGL